MSRPTWRFRWWWAMVVLLVLAASPVYAAGAQPPFVNGPLRDAVLPPPTWVDQMDLSTGVAETYTVPNDSNSAFAQEPSARVAVVIQPESSCPDLYVRPIKVNGVTVGAAAALPSGEKTDGTASMRNPPALDMKQGDTLSFIAPTACKVQLMLYLERF